MYGDRRYSPYSGTWTTTPGMPISFVAALAQVENPVAPNLDIFKFWFIDSITPLVGVDAARVLRKRLNFKNSTDAKDFLTKGLKFQINLELGLLNETDADKTIKFRQENARDAFPHA